MDLGLPYALRVVIALISVVLVLGIERRVRVFAHSRRLRVFLVLAGGALLAVAMGYLEREVLGRFMSSLELDGGRGDVAMVMLFVPLEEAAKALVVWPLYATRRLPSERAGAVYALVAAAGFAAVELLLAPWVSGDSSWFGVMRSAVAVPAHLFFAGAWGYMLGGAERDRYFGATWLVVVLLHGVYDYVLFARGSGLVVVLVPMLVMMSMGLIVLVRAPIEVSRSTAISLWEPPSVGQVREVLSRRGRPLLLHWIAIGAFVTVGVTLVFLGVGVYLGHQLGIDFALADEAGVEGMVPIALLGAALLAAFPVSAYLIARASGTQSVLEPAWAAGAAIIAVVALFSVTEPTALAIALGTAPVAFVLACAGAWFGLDH